ncbi:hypothetical protein [Mesobacillus maritimus]|uniref:hypothetical protein n=1 Tax=Mesobacillus maritimus TaxID=1643336 RepID=UPI00384D9F54
MKHIKQTQRKSLCIFLSSLIVVVGIVGISQIYFSYVEVRDLTDNCYDNGGLPTIVKSGLKVDTFNCEID